MKMKRIEKYKITYLIVRLLLQYDLIEKLNERKGKMYKR